MRRTEAGCGVVLAMLLAGTTAKAQSLFASLLRDSGNGNADDRCAADVNESGTVNGRDIQSFVNILLGS